MRSSTSAKQQGRKPIACAKRGKKQCSLEPAQKHNKGGPVLVQRGKEQCSQKPDAASRED
eukprot:1148386-Pelagomonas_calceolata.AAC.4